jgi:hypothetical protein
VGLLAIPAGHRIGPSGLVNAVDLAAGLVATGRRRAEADGLDGLLSGLYDVLAPYFATGIDPALFDDPADPALVELLYRPLYDALSTLNHRT